MAGRMVLSDRDVRTMLRVVHPDDEASGPTQPIPVSVLAGLSGLIGCTSISFFQLDSERRTLPASQDLPEEDFTEALKAQLTQAFWTHYPDSPSCRYPDESGDLTTVTAMSDFYTRRELHRTGMYADYLRPQGVEREIMLCLPSPRYRTVRLMLARGPGSDFSDRDRAILTLLRPHLYETYLRGVSPPEPPLTPRQKELLRFVAAGCTNRQIARKLSVAESTVRKHLENIFDRLQVTSRAAAVARVFGAQSG
jgi:DNA-binding CsgD family transcriptional regulator